MNVRRAERREARTLAELHLRSALVAYAPIFPPEAPKPAIDVLADHWATALATDATTALVIDVDGWIGGVVLAGPDEAEPDAGHLSRLYVDPDRWGHGLGRALYTASMDMLRERFDEATLWVLERNTRARAWYERLGWRPTGERKPVYSPAGIDDLRYRLTSI